MAPSVIDQRPSPSPAASHSPRLALVFLSSNFRFSLSASGRSRCGSPREIACAAGVDQRFGGCVMRGEVGAAAALLAQCWG